MPQSTPLKSFVKASIDGKNGNGKTGTAARLAVGLALEYGNGGPVIVADSEERWRFIDRNIFQVEGIPLIRVNGGTLVGVLESLTLAEKKGAAVWVGDQLTTPWKEAVDSFSFGNGELTFKRRQQLEHQWDPLVQGFRYGQFHAIGCGRLGYNWQNVEDENGEMQLIQGESKFNAGGGNNFGYEADLELEMQRKTAIIGTQKFMGKFFGAKPMPRYLCNVIKDAASELLNGQQFAFEAKPGAYQKGDYKTVLNAFRPYIDYMRMIDAPQPATNSSRDLIVTGKTDWARDQSMRKGYCEEIENLLNQCFPGGEKLSALHKMYRNLTLEYLNGFSSWSRMEEEIATINLDRNVKILHALRTRLTTTDRITDQSSLAAVLHLATDDVLDPGHGVTLLELMTAKSVDAVKAGKRGPQPVVQAMDRGAEEAFGD